MVLLGAAHYKPGFGYRVRKYGGGLILPGQLRGIGMPQNGLVVGSGFIGDLWRKFKANPAGMGKKIVSTLISGIAPVLINKGIGAATKRMGFKNNSIAKSFANRLLSSQASKILSGVRKKVGVGLKRKNGGAASVPKAKRRRLNPVFGSGIRLQNY